MSWQTERLSEGKKFDSQPFEAWFKGDSLTFEKGSKYTLKSHVNKFHIQIVDVTTGRGEIYGSYGELLKDFDLYFGVEKKDIVGDSYGN